MAEVVQDDCYYFNDSTSRVEPFTIGIQVLCESLVRHPPPFGTPVLLCLKQLEILPSFSLT